jgi:hypothetical protein
VAAPALAQQTRRGKWLHCALQVIFWACQLILMADFG